MADALFVVIATSGRASLLGRTLTSLLECRRPPIYRGTIVVENGERGDAEAICRRFAAGAGTRYLYVSEPNKSRALNEALSHISDGLVYFADDDIRFHPDTLDAYALAAEGLHHGLFFGGPFGVDYEMAPPDWLIPYLPNSAKGWELEEDATTVDRPLFLGFNWAAFAGDLRAAGGFDIRMGPGGTTISTVGDEYDMQNRLLKAGITGRYVPSARVWHHVPRDRCTTAWAIRRRYQTSLALAGRQGGADDGARTWYSAHRRWIVAPARILLAALTFNRSRLFSARYWSSHERGLFDGHRTLRRRKSA